MQRLRDTMSYAIYTTQAIILRIIPNGEANVDVVFFTREFGKIVARAQGVRKPQSTMRMFLTRFRLVTIDLVKGKHVWRLTGITGEPLGAGMKHDAILIPIHRIFRLSEFLIQGEMPQQGLFELYRVLLNQAAVSRGKGLEIFGVIKLLEHLGYWHGNRFADTPSAELFEQCYEQRKELVQQINQSISATQIVVY